MKKIHILLLLFICNLLASAYQSFAQQTFSNFQDANLVIGQPDFTSLLTQVSESVTPYAISVAISSKGMLAVGSAKEKVHIWYSMPVTNGQPADVVLNVSNNFGVAFSPDGTKLLVSEPYNNRVLIWNSIPTTSSQPADVVIGQTDMNWASTFSGISATKLNSPGQISFAKDGRLILSDMNNNRVLIYNSIPTTNGVAADVVIGQSNFTSRTSNNTASGLCGPWGNTVSPDGKLLIADQVNNRVVIFNSIPTTNGASADVVIGQSGFGLSTGGISATKLHYPIGVSVSPSGQLAIGDSYNHRVLIYNKIPTYHGAPANIVLGQPDFNSNTNFNGGVSAKSMASIHGVLFDEAGRLFVSGKDMHRVMVFGNILKDQSISFEEIADKKLGEGSFTLSATASSGLAVSYTSSNPAVATISGNTVTLVGTGDAVITASQAGDATYAAAEDVKQILLVNPDVWPSVASSYVFSGRLSSKFAGPLRMSTDSKGNIYVTDRYNHRIQKFSADGTLLLTIGSNGAGDGQFNEPAGVDTDLEGNIYVADYANHRVQKFDSKGNFLLKFGSYGTGNGQFNLAAGVTVDWLGQVYVSDHLNHRIQKFTSSGEFVAVLGSHGSADGQFRSPADIAVDRRGHVYVADQNNHRVQKFSPEWQFMLQVGSHGTADGQFNYVPAVDVDAQGYIYIVDVGNNRIQKFDASGQFIGKFGAEGSGDGQLSGPSGIAVGTDGAIYVADYNNNRVERFVPEKNKAPVLEAIGNKTINELATLTLQASATDDGLPTDTITFTLAAAGTGTYPIGASITEAGSFSWTPTEEQGPGTYRVKIVVSDGELSSEEEIEIQVSEVREPTTLSTDASCLPNAVLSLSNAADASQIIWYKDGTAVSNVTPNPATEGTTVAGGNGVGSAAYQLYGPRGMFVDREGSVYIADRENNRIQKWKPGATEGITVAGGNGGGSAANQLSTPTGVFVDTNGNVFVADQSNSRVQKWVPGATSGTTVAGGNGEGTAAHQLGYPDDVFVDANGNIYVADQSNHRIQKWAPGATEGTTVAGGKGAGTAANQLNNPVGVFVDVNGDIYVADRENNRIQKWKPGATEGITVAGGNGGSAANQLFGPSGVFVDSNGNMYIADAGNHRIQKWAPGATSGTTITGGNGGGSAANQLFGPTEVYVDANGDIYIADNGNHRIQKWAAPTITTTYTPTVAGVYTAEVTFETGTVITNADTIHGALVVATPAAITQVNDKGQCSAVVTLSNPEITYNCEIGSISNDAPTGNVFPVGTTLVTWSVADAYGNVTTVKQEVTITDEEAPVVLTQPITVALDATGKAAITTSQVDNGSYDNCGIASMSLSQSSFNCASLGADTVMLTVTDVHGNTASSDVIVTVEDRMQPSITAPVDITVGNDPDKCGALVDIGVATATDNCSIATISSYAPPDGFFPVGITEVIWTAVDGSGNTSTAVQYITVTNEVPVIGDIRLPVDPQPIGQAIQASASYIDNNAYHAIWNWGDGTESFGEVRREVREVTGTHTYADAGVYTVTLILFDVCGDYAVKSNVQETTSSSGARISSANASISSTTTSYEFTYLVSYDASGGFVTGGGWIYSPKGAYVYNKSAEGKANFGFVAKYKKGANIPEGNTEFRFNAANFEFRSTSYEWLVVAGAKAMYKGYGTVNGEAGYGFLLSAIDGDMKTTPEPDKFRIKIWDSAGNTVYDNQMGSTDDADATMALGGGSIVIHDPNSKNARHDSATAKEQAIGGEGIETPAAFKLNVYPNPLQKELAVELESDTEEEVTISIFDLLGRKVYEQKQKVAIGNNQIMLDVESWKVTTDQLLFRLQTPSKGLHQLMLLKPE